MKVSAHVLLMAICTLQSMEGSPRLRLDSDGRVDRLRLAVSATATSTLDGHTCALVGAAIRCWGLNSAGQLGLGDTAMRLSPTSLLNDPAVSVVAGERHTCLLRTSGNVQCWGNNSVGQLGDGTLTSRPTPGFVSNIDKAVGIAAGRQHACALLVNGTVRCWGDGGIGQLGSPKTVSTTPRAIAGLDQVISIAAGANHTCALRANGAVLCWGQNADGQLGRGNYVEGLTPAAVTGLDDAVSISAGLGHTCVVRSVGTVSCWGRNSEAQVGIGAITGPGVATPATVNGLNAIVSVSAGQNHTCVIRQNGSAACWGGNSNGQVGNGLSGSNFIQLTPANVLGLTAVSAIAAGNQYTCAITALGGGFCWGANGSGQLGNGTQSPSATPSAAAGITGGTTARALSLSGRHNCALRTNGTMECWGNERVTAARDDLLTLWTVEGRLGCSILDVVGTLNCFYRGGLSGGSSGLVGASGPFDITVVAADGSVRSAGFPVNLDRVVGVSAGRSHACALRANGTVWCWGQNTFGQLGNGNNSGASVDSPQQVIGLTNVVQLATGFDHSCAILADGSARCWGANTYGQLGDGTTDPRSLPIVVQGVTDAIQIAAAGERTCATTATSRALCWGASATPSGELSRVPVQVVERYSTFRGIETPIYLANVVKVETGNTHACALQATGAVLCWGQSSGGLQLDGTVTSSLLPVRLNSFTANVAPQGTVQANGVDATVTVVMTCTLGDQAKLSLSLTQGGVMGRDFGVAACTGDLQRILMRVTARGSEHFATGPATAEIEAEIRRHGDLTEHQKWSRQVTLVAVP